MALVPNVCMHVCMYVCHFMSCYVTLELQNQVGTGRSYVCTARQLIVPYDITDTTIKHVFFNNNYCCCLANKHVYYGHSADKIFQQDID